MVYFTKYLFLSFLPLVGLRYFHDPPLPPFTCMFETLPCTKSCRHIWAHCESDLAPTCQTLLLLLECAQCHGLLLLPMRPWLPFEETATNDARLCLFSAPLPCSGTGWNTLMEDFWPGYIGTVVFKSVILQAIL